MTISDYIKKKFQSFGIGMSEADLMDVWIDGGDNDLTSSNKKDVEIAMASFIPQLLMRPTSIKEGGVELEWDVDAIQIYYSFLCKKYGLEDLLNSEVSSDVSVISDASDRW